MKIAMKGRAAFLVKDDTLMEQPKKPYRVEFAFDDTWGGYEKIVVFRAGAITEEVSLTDDVCTIPPKCLETGGVTLKVGVYGKKDGETTERIWCLSSRILCQTKIDVPARSDTSSGGASDTVYQEIQKTLQELSNAGYEGMSLAEVLDEVRNAADFTATDEEVDSVIEDIFDSAHPHNPSDAPNDASDDGAVTDGAVDDLLDNVFGDAVVNKYYEGGHTHV